MRRLAPPAAVVVAGALLALWLIADPRTPDLAAAVYRVELFRQLGFAIWDEHWYAGHHLPGYSLLFPPLGSLLGIRLLGAVCVLCSAALFDRLVRGVYGHAGRLAACWFAVAAVADVWVGRIAFALGVPLALAAVLCLRRQRPLLAGGLAVMCAAASPVAGALLGLAAVSAAFARATPRALLTLAVPAAVTVLALALVFPEGGFEPYPLLSFLATAVVVLAFLWALPQRQPLLRAGASIYLLACVVCLLIHSPMGSNVERYGVLLAGPLLLCVRPRPTAGVAVALCVAAGWVLWGPARETLAVGGGESTKAAYYTPVEQFLAAQQAPARVEVPLTRSHWEAAQLAPSVSLARGWEKQLDERFDRVLLAPGLTVATYDRWLHEQAVTYVALPDARLDPSSAQEGRLIARGLPYLREVFASRHWRIYKVLVPTPLIAGPGRLTSLGHDSFTLRAVSRGDILVRVRFTRYWTVAHGNACVRSAPGGWTSVKAGAPGSVIVAARFSLARALGSAETCTRSGS